MPDKKNRLELIKKLEARRGSRLVAYVTGDRQGGLETRIGMDVFPSFYDVLAHLGGRTEQIDLFLYSTSGATMAVRRWTNSMEPSSSFRRCHMPGSATGAMFEMHVISSSPSSK